MDRLAVLGDFRLRVVDAGSFSAVARRQRIGQPAVSKAVVQLEEWLGVSLLMRSTRGLVPTEAGRIFYERAKRTIEEAHEAVLAARGSARRPLGGTLRVSASILLWAAPYHSEIVGVSGRTILDLDLELVLDDRLVDLVNEGIDVALRTGAMPNSNDDGAPDRRGSQRCRGHARLPEAPWNAHIARRAEQPSGHRPYSGRRPRSFPRSGRPIRRLPVTLKGRLKVTQAEWPGGRR